MFTRVFKETSFWSYALAFVLLLLAVYGHHFFIEKLNPSNNLVLKSIVAGFLSLISIVLVEVTVRQALFFQRTNYHLFIFILFFAMLPISKWSIWVWISVLFFWSSVLIIMKLDENESEKKSIFNAGLWLVFAILFKTDFYFFYVILWAVLYFKGRLNISNIFLTFLPFVSLYIIWAALSELFPNLLIIGKNGFITSSFNALMSDNTQENTGLFFILLASIIFVFKHVKEKYQARKREKLNLRVCILILFSSLSIVLFRGEENAITWIAFVMASSVLSAQFLNSIKSKLLLEGFFIICLCIIFQDALSTIAGVLI